MQESVYVIDDADSVCTVVDGIVKTTLPPASINFSCGDSKMHNASTWLGIAGLMFMGILMSRSFKGSIITGEPCINPSHLLPSDNSMRSPGSCSAFQLQFRKWLGIADLTSSSFKGSNMTGEPCNNPYICSFRITACDHRQLQSIQLQSECGLA